VRDTALAEPLAQQGIEVRHGDFNNPGTLADAFAGADTVFINGTNYGTAPAVRAGQQAAAIRAAEAAGATRIVITSWQDLSNCPLEIATDFPATEKLVAESSAAWTILRLVNGMAASLARDVQAAVATGTLAAPAGDARATPAAVPDLAEAAANVLVEAGHDGKTYELTGPDAITWDDLASLAATFAAKEIHYRSTSDDEFRVQVLAMGFPAGAIDSLIAYYGAFRAGWANNPGPDLAHLLRRPATASLDAVRQVVKL
jgi:NAD(P)H dehydrogenase (quinone)